MEVKIEIWEADELPLLQDFWERLDAHRIASREIRYHEESFAAAYAPEQADVPAQPIEEVLDEIHLADKKDATLPVPRFDVTEADAVAAFRAAAAKGAMPKIVAALEAAGVKRVTELQAEQRAAFVEAIS